MREVQVRDARTRLHARSRKKQLFAADTHCRPLYPQSLATWNLSRIAVRKPWREGWQHATLRLAPRAWPPLHSAPREGDETRIASRHPLSLPCTLQTRQPQGRALSAVLALLLMLSLGLVFDRDLLLVPIAAYLLLAIPALLVLPSRI